MAGITLAQAEAQLALYLAAEAAVLNNQRYKIGDRELERADLAEIRNGVKTWDERVKSLAAKAAGRSRTFYAVTGR